MSLAVLSLLTYLERVPTPAIAEVPQPSRTWWITTCVTMMR